MLPFNWRRRYCWKDERKFSGCCWSECGLILQKLTTNLQDENILGMHFKTPLDIQRYNNALVETDIQHIGFYNWQLGGNRPVPGWGQYRTPVAKLYMTGGSTHPGGGVTGGPGRNAAQVIMEDFGLDFDAATV